ncbi:hypothetical protein SELMODRAFT_426792 [Selaginella moellendorffii]|uniref:Uncharacterized protein n=1 Tax=Selaginella moellendorffii TaxID=88036 RepID=D8SXH9_SELML|nr:hypothetical protein SELMODRAFT_426792 [Selaginella moellendorffii]
MPVERRTSIGSCSSTGSNALAVRRDRRRRQPSWMKFFGPEHLQERDCWFAVHKINSGGLDSLVVHNAVSKACFKIPLCGSLGRLGGSGSDHTFTSANSGLVCTFRGQRFSQKPALMHVFNPFKSEAFQVTIPPKTVIYTAAIVPKASSSKEFRVVAMAEFGEVTGVYIYESGTKVLLLGEEWQRRIHSLDFFGADGVEEYAESIRIVEPNLFLCKGKLTVVDTVVTGSPSSGRDEDEDEEYYPDVDDYSEVIIWQMDEQAYKWETVAKMPDDLWRKLHVGCDMYSKLKVCGAGKFVFMQFVHWTPWEHRAADEDAVICNLDTGVWEELPPKPPTIMFSRCLDVLILDPDQSFAL